MIMINNSKQINKYRQMSYYSLPCPDILYPPNGTWGTKPPPRFTLNIKHTTVET